MRQLQDEIDSAEFAEWQAYDLLNPIGSEPIEHAIAELCALTWNIHKREEVKEATPGDFKFRLMLMDEEAGGLELADEDLDERTHKLFAGLM